MLQVLRLGEIEPIAEGDAHVFRCLFPQAFMVFLEREDVGITGAEQYFFQSADLIDNFIVKAFAGHAGFTLDDKQFVGLHEAHIQLVIMLDDAVGDMHAHGDVVGLKHVFDQGIDIFLKPTSSKIFYLIALQRT